MTKVRLTNVRSRRRRFVGAGGLIAVTVIATAATVVLAAWAGSSAIATVVGGATALLALSGVAFTYFRNQRAYLQYQRRRSAEERTFRSRIADVRRHMTHARELMVELEDELATRSKALEQLQADAKRYERLATLNSKQAKAIEDLVGRQFQRQGRTATWQWWASIVLAIVFGFLVNWLSTPLWNWITH
jgi:hypothetical protein